MVTGLYGTVVGKMGEAFPLGLLGDGPFLDPEIEVLGFYLPFALIIILAGFIAAWLVAWVMDFLGLTRFVWHPPLFMLALLVGCSAGLGLLLFPR